LRIELIEFIARYQIRSTLGLAEWSVDTIYRATTQLWFSHGLDPFRTSAIF
jgi:hypothetical protein